MGLVRRKGVIALSALALVTAVAPGARASQSLSAFDVPTSSCAIQASGTIDVLALGDQVFDCVDETEEGTVPDGIDVEGTVYQVVPDLGDGCSINPSLPYKSSKTVVSGDSTFSCGNPKNFIFSAAYIQVKVKSGSDWKQISDIVGKYDSDRSSINSGRADGGCRPGGNNGKLYRVVGDGGWVSASGVEHNFKPKPGDPVRLGCPLTGLVQSP